MSYQPPQQQPSVGRTAAGVSLGIILVPISVGVLCCFGCGVMAIVGAFL